MIEIETIHKRKDVQSLFRFLGTAVPWQYLYKRTLGKPRKQNGTLCWSILRSHQDGFDPLTFRPEQMIQVRSNDLTTRADPFHCTYQGQSYLFLEEWPKNTHSGHLSVMRLNEAGIPEEPPVAIVQNETHFSYPFTFEYQGTLWMLPENAGSNRLQIHRCLKFPHQWVPDKVLMQGMRYADPTLFEHDGRWWLFMTLGTGFHGVNTALFLFSADNPLSDDWTPHPMNPIVTGFHKSRSAGRIFSSKGKLYRPSQDCMKRYGHGLRISEIIHLDKERYEERCVNTFFPWKEEVHGIHHLEICGDRVFMDILAISSSPLI